MKGMKGRHIGLWAGIALLGLLGVLGELIRPALAESYAPWDGMEEWFSPEPVQIEKIARDLAASGDAKKLAFAAILGQTLENRFGSKGQYVRSLEHLEESPEEKSEHAMPQETLDNWQKMALEKAKPDDVWVFSMLATFGAAKSESAKAVREQAIVRWQQAEPDNLAPLLHQQGLSTSELFERSKTRHQFIEYNYPILRWMYQTLLQQLPNQQKSITTELIGIDSATSVILAKPLLEFCKKNPPEHSSADWHSCRFIAQTLRQSPSSSAIPPIIGTNILQIVASDEAEKQIFNNERAYFGWLLEQPTQHMDGVRLLEQYSQRLQDENINSELQAIESFLLQEGLPLKPDEESLKPFLEKYKQ